MTTLPHNIEKSAFNRGEYVGYAAGYVFRVERSNSSFGNWTARLARFNPVNPRLSNRIFYGFTLVDMGKQLDGFAEEISKKAIVGICAA
jgi:hypothetical protein